MTKICKYCGACIPPRQGEGRCPKCAPFAVRWHVFKRWWRSLW